MVLLLFSPSAYVCQHGVEAFSVELPVVLALSWSIMSFNSLTHLSIKSASMSQGLDDDMKKRMRAVAVRVGADNVVLCDCFLFVAG